MQPPRARTMAKPLGEKSRKLREAIKAHPDKGNTEIAALLAGQHPELGFKPSDVAAQRQAMKRLAGEGGEEDEEEGDQEALPSAAPAQEAARATGPAATPSTGTDPAALMDRLFD